MGMVVDKPFAFRPPRASKQVNRDTAVRWRAVPKDVVKELNADTLLIPRDFMLGGNSELMSSLMARIDQLERAVFNGWSKSDADATVVPMKPTQKTQPEGSSSHGTSVSGNEAEELYPASAESGPAEVSKTPAANDETAEILLLPAPEQASVPADAANDEVTVPAADHSEGWLDQVATQLGFTTNEVVNFLGEKYTLYNGSAMRKHGLTFQQVRAVREVAKEGIVTPGVYLKAECSRFKEWNETAATVAIMSAPLTRAHRLKREAKVRPMIEGDKKDVYYRSMAYASVKAYDKREKRRIRDLKADIKSRTHSIKFVSECKDAAVNRLAHEPHLHPTMGGWWQAARLGVRDRFDSVRRFFGRSTPNRQQKQLAKMGITTEAPITGHSGVVTPTVPDLTTPTRELVRRYQLGQIA